MKRTLIAALVGGLVMFVWGAISHMALPLGEMGLQSLPEDERLMEAMRGAIPQAGMYFFPGMRDQRNPTAEETAAWEARYRSGPVGLLLYQTRGGEPMSARQLAIELITDVLAAAVASWVVARIAGPFARRVFTIALLGILGWLSISASQWNWYGFPTAFFVAEGIDQLAGWTLSGLAIAWIVPPPSSAAS